MSVRFAPSPTGPFHVGNLRTAWISCAFARELGMPWIVRFEDIDTPRVIRGAREAQLEDMSRFGMTPDRIIIQSDRCARHEALFREAVASGAIYPCTCSRKELHEELQSIASAPHGETPLYSGHCRNRVRDSVGSSHPTLAWRFKNPEDEAGRLDFIVARTNPDGADFVPAYHWACAIDDFDSEPALLVRAWDLAQAARLQARVHAWVGSLTGDLRPYPAVFHASLVTANDGSRLEKRTRGITLNEVLASGTPAEELLRRFEASFDRGLFAQFAPERIWGEKRERISLNELGW